MPTQVDIDIKVRGLERIQAAARQVVEAMTEGGALGKAVRHVALGAHRYATDRTVVDTGTWRASQRVEVKGLRGRIFIDPSAVNPKGGGKPSEYGAGLELRRGGRYAAYQQTFDQAGMNLLKEGAKIVEDALP